MKKKVFLLALGLLLLGNSLKAQTSMTVPYGSFEQWSSHPGYSASLMGLSVPIYDTFSTPTGWNHLAYPVSGTYSIVPGLSVTINTAIPLVKASRETGTVPDGTKAVRLQTIMLEDIVNANVYSILSTTLDSTLTQTVFPSVLSTGEVDLETFLPIVTNLLSNMDSVQQILSSLALMDVNELITGGIALGAFEPSRLTGNYKYHSATTGDNGGVLMLGTHYNTTTQQRDVVGGGANISLTDITNYTPFTVNYLSLHELDASFPLQAPDSLIIIILSSASDSMQQGSYLCLDNLVLWHDTVEITEPDTCAAIASLTATPDIHEAVINWSATDVVDGYELHYGTAGFTPGGGNQILLTNNTASLAGLAANTLYDVYVRTRCTDSIYGEWASLQFQTNPDTCASVHDLRIENQVYDAFPEYAMNWYSYSRVDYWEIEYGPQGFEPGNGTVVSTDEPLEVFHSEQYGNYWYCTFDIYVWESRGILQPNTEYAFYVRSVCEDGVYGEWDSVHYRTFCAMVDSIKAWDDNLSVTPDNLISGYVVTWRDTTDSQRWWVEYAEVGNLPGLDGSGFDAYVDTPMFNMPNLKPATQYWVSIASLCGEDNMSDRRWIYFTTPNLEGIEQANELPLAVSPNPAHGSCTVSLPGGEPAELKLYSLDGRLLQTVAANGTTVTLQLPAQGVYLLQATTASGTATRKIISK